MSGLLSLITFDPRRAYRKVRMYAVLTSPVVVLGVLAATLAVIVCAVFVALGNEVFLAFGVLSGSVALLLSIALLFASTYYPYVSARSTVAELIKQAESNNNIADAASFPLLRVITPRIARRSEKDITVVLRALLKTASGKYVLRRLQLDKEQLIAQVLAQVAPSFSWQEFAYNTLNVADRMGAAEIEPVHALAVFLLHPNLSRYLRDNQLTQEDISFMAWWESRRALMGKVSREWWRADALLQFTGIGLSWASGYTPFVDKFNRIPNGNIWDVPYGKQSQIDQLINTLSRRRQGNVLLVGQPGVGRLGVLKEAARRINTNQAHPALNGQRVMYVHVGELLSLAASGPEQMAFVSRALHEMEQAGNVIAVLDGVGSILGGAQQAVNLTDILLPFLSSQTVRVVIVMSQEEYHLRIKTNEELIHLFDIVQVPPLNADTTLQLLALTSAEWESISNVFIPYQSLREIVDSTKTILPHIPFPEKAFDILEEVIVQAQGAKKKEITPEDINALLSHKIGINIGRIKQREGQQLLKLEDFIHQRVVNQKRGVAAVARAMIRARAHVRNQGKPIGTFLFLGPTGVGKTEASKALAEAYFGSEEYLQRLDMTEFQSEDGVSRLIGTLERPVGRLTSLISDHPFCVLLLDEFEKAHPTVQQLFLQVFDEGYVNDAGGRQYSFKHCILISTSNAGAEYIRQNVGEDGTIPENFDTKLRDHILEQAIFRPELLNRFDGVITFTPLTKEHIRQIAHLMLQKFNKRLDAAQGMKIAITDELVDFLVSIGYNPEFGARPMARAIQDTVEYAVAEEILRQTAQPGDSIALSVQKLQALKTNA